MSDAALALPLPDSLPLGTVLAGRYRIGELIAVGGMGIVYEGFHLLLEQRVAVKVVRPEYAHQPEAIARFMNEARAIARLRGNHIARVLDTGCLPDGPPYMVLELLEGADLRAVLEAEAPLPLERALNYLLQTCEAVAEAHALGMVHRDLKPENLFITRGPDGEEVVKVIDFGISKRVGAEARCYTLQGQSLGSPQYMAPEQMSSPDKVDARADIWSLGVVLHELLSNTVPFQGETVPEICANVLTKAPLSVRVARPDLPLGIEQVIDRCLQKAREDRFSDVSELVAALLPSASTAGAASGRRAQRIIERPDMDATPVESSTRLKALRANLDAPTRKANKLSVKIEVHPRRRRFAMRWLAPVAAVAGLLTLSFAQPDWVYETQLALVHGLAPFAAGTRAGTANEPQLGAADALTSLPTPSEWDSAPLASTDADPSPRPTVRVVPFEVAARSAAVAARPAPPGRRAAVRFPPPRAAARPLQLRGLQAAGLARIQVDAASPDITPEKNRDESDLLSPYPDPPLKSRSDRQNRVQAAESSSP